MEITINVQVGVTPALQQLCEAFLEKHSAESIIGGLTPNRIEVPEVEIKDEPKQSNEAPKDEPKVEPKEAPAKEENAPITNVMLRDAMENVRKQFEFTDAEHPEVANADLHKKLTKMFKEIAHELGAEKPTALPEGKSREQFLERLAWIKMDNGEFTCLPF